MREAIAAGRRAGLPADELDELDGWLGSGRLRRPEASGRHRAAARAAGLRGQQPGAEAGFVSVRRDRILGLLADRSGPRRWPTSGAVTPDTGPRRPGRAATRPCLHGYSRRRPRARSWPDGRPIDDGYALDADSVRQMADDLWHELGLDDDDDVDRVDGPAPPRCRGTHEAARRRSQSSMGPQAGSWPRFVPPCWRSCGCRRTTPACVRERRPSDAAWPPTAWMASKTRSASAMTTCGPGGSRATIETGPRTSSSTHGPMGSPTMPSFRQAVIDEYHFVSRSGLTDDDIARGYRRHRPRPRAISRGSVDHGLGVGPAGHPATRASAGATSTEDDIVGSRRR